MRHDKDSYQKSDILIDDAYSKVMNLCRDAYHKYSIQDGGEKTESHCYEVHRPLAQKKFLRRLIVAATKPEEDTDPERDSERDAEDDIVRHGEEASHIGRGASYCYTYYVGCGTHL